MSLSLAQAKNGFLDRELIAGLLDGVTLRYYTRMGGFVRTTARRSIKPVSESRTDKKTGQTRRVNRSESKPGDPPRSRGGQLREGIAFSVDPQTRQLVIGPVRLSGTRQRPGVPKLHEFGGSVQRQARTITVKDKPDRDASGRFVPAGTSRRVKVPAGAAEYPARPFMRPAFDKALARSANFLRQAVRQSVSNSRRRPRK